MAKTRVAPDPNVAANLALLMKVFTDLGTQQELARKSGVGQTTIGRILRKEVSPTGENLRRLADAFNVDVGYLYYRPEHFAERLQAGATRRLPAEPPPLGVDQTVSYHPADHQLLTRESVMELEKSKNLPQRFYFALEDNAMGADWPKGTVVVFQRMSRLEEAEPGDGIMVRTGDGRLVVRYLAEGTSPQGWMAIAADRDIFRDLDSTRDQLTPVALWLAPAESRLSRRR